MKLRQLFSLVLCFAVLLISAVPAFAFPGSVHYTTTVNNANVCCTGYMKGASEYYKHRADIDLSFSPNVNHPPASDYYTKIKVTIIFDYGVPYTQTVHGYGNLTYGPAGFYPNDYTITNAKFRYYVVDGSTPIHTASIT